MPNVAMNANASVDAAELGEHAAQRGDQRRRQLLRTARCSRHTRASPPTTAPTTAVDRRQHDRLRERREEARLGEGL